MWLRDTVHQTSRGWSDRPAADHPRDVCLYVSRNHRVFLLSSTFHHLRFPFDQLSICLVFVVDVKNFFLARDRVRTPVYTSTFNGVHRVAQPRRRGDVTIPLTGTVFSNGYCPSSVPATVVWTLAEKSAVFRGFRINSFVTVNYVYLNLLFPA